MGSVYDLVGRALCPTVFFWGGGGRNKLTALRGVELINDLTPAGVWWVGGGGDVGLKARPTWEAFMIWRVGLYARRFGGAGLGRNKLTALRGVELINDLTRAGVWWVGGGGDVGRKARPTWGAFMIWWGGLYAQRFGGAGLGRNKLTALRGVELINDLTCAGASRSRRGIRSQPARLGGGR